MREFKKVAVLGAGAMGASFAAKFFEVADYSKVVELGKTYGIPTPVNQTLLQIIRILEQSSGATGRSIAE